jgi:hypothetical protein
MLDRIIHGKDMPRRTENHFKALCCREHFNMPLIAIFFPTCMYTIVQLTKHSCAVHGGDFPFNGSKNKAFIWQAI